MKIRTILAEILKETYYLQLPVHVGNMDEELGEECENNGLFGTATLLIDPKYRLLDMLTPDAKQNRLSNISSRAFA